MSRLIASFAAAAAIAASTSAFAVEISISCSALGKEYEICKQGVDAWAQEDRQHGQDRLDAEFRHRAPRPVTSTCSPPAPATSTCSRSTWSGPASSAITCST